MKILTHPNEELRIPSEPVVEERFGTDALRALVDRLTEAMVTYDGVGIAAPQVGIKDRIFIADLQDGLGPRALINPAITKRSRGTFLFEEGCLSVPGVYGMVERHKKVTLEARNVDGQPMSFQLARFPAVIAQHEIDHLDGILFIDKVTERTHGTDVKI